MATIRMELRTDKPDKTGHLPIRLIFSTSGQRKYFNTRFKVRLENWDPTTSQAIYLDRAKAKKLLPSVPYNILPTDKEVSEINDGMLGLRLRVWKIMDRFRLNDVKYSADMVVTTLKHEVGKATKKEAPTNEVFVFIDKYITDHAGTREPGSLSVYRALKNHLQAFQTEKRKKISFDTIDYSFFQEFQSFLIAERKLNNTTVAKQLSTIKTFLNYARIQGIPVSNAYKDFKIKKETLEVIALTASEFEKLFYLDLTGNDKLSKVRDVFCFSCVTGLRYSDLYQLKREHIKGDELRITVKKTKEPLSIPLTPYSQLILDRYSSQHRPLPVISNQKLNEYVKELCKKAEIDEAIEIVRFRGTKREAVTYPKYELISVHTGRKTFATLSLEKGMSAEEVMTITGHLDYRSFKRYVKVTEQRKKVVMKNAWGEIRLPKLKAV
jgi:integrase